MNRGVFQVPDRRVPGAEPRSLTGIRPDDTIFARVLKLGHKNSPEAR
jgi:hypothetical protein